MSQDVQEFVQHTSKVDSRPTKLNPVPTIFSFPTHLQPITRRKRTDPEENKTKQNKTKPTLHQGEKLVKLNEQGNPGTSGPVITIAGTGNCMLERQGFYFI